jgi:argininosuccinate lyase
MAQILDDVRAGRFAWSIEREDVHLNIEHRLTELVGDAGKRLHTARSRNDQVATDLRLWLRAEIDTLQALLRTVRERLLEIAERHAATLMPGFTHLQVAQPVTFGHHLMAYFEMFSRDAGRLADCRRRTNRLPLGASALAGTSYPIDREWVAKELGFDGVCENSLDAVSDRDFAIEFLAAAAVAMAHVSRLAEELVIWMNPRFGFVRIADRFCTGSSIMPQKKNPDVAELMRGKSGRVFGSLVALLTVVKGQPLAYNKDNQEDKEPLFDTADTLRDVLAILAEMLPAIEPVPERMRAALAEGFATATDLADYLVRKGLPFRDAHEVVARAVREAEAERKDLAELPLERLRAFSPLIGDDVRAALTPKDRWPRASTSAGRRRKPFAPPSRGPARRFRRSPPPSLRKSSRSSASRGRRAGRPSGRNDRSAGKASGSARSCCRRRRSGLRCRPASSRAPRAAPRRRCGCGSG